MKQLNKFIKDCVDSMYLNANDIFGYASCFSVEIEVNDLPKLLDIFNKYGNDGVVAFMSKVTGMKPLKEYINSNYKRAKNELKEYVLYEDFHQAYGQLDKDKQIDIIKNNYILKE